MSKREIYAKEILNDIRSGMDDGTLMRKYKLTVKGLESAFQKLLSGGLISERRLEVRKLGYEETVNLSGLFTFLEPAAAPMKEQKRIEYSYSGMVEGIDILDYIQWVLLDGRTTVLEIRFPEATSCKLYFKEGRMLHAVMGRQEGEEAFYLCMMCPSGLFSHLPWTDPERKTIDKPGTQILFEAARRRDEAEM